MGLSELIIKNTQNCRILGKENDYYKTLLSVGVISAYFFENVVGVVVTVSDIELSSDGN